MNTVTLSRRDWGHVLNAIESSFTRKLKRGDEKAADEMWLIYESVVYQCLRTKEAVR